MRGRDAGGGPIRLSLQFVWRRRAARREARPLVISALCSLSSSTSLASPVELNGSPRQLTIGDVISALDFYRNFTGG